MLPRKPSPHLQHGVDGFSFTVRSTAVYNSIQGLFILTMTLSNKWKTSFIGLSIATTGSSAVSAFSITSRGGKTVVAPSHSTHQQRRSYTSCIIPFYSSSSSTSSSLTFRRSINNGASSDVANNNIDSVWHEALLNTPAESILPIIDHTDYGPINHELRMALLSLDSPSLVEVDVEEENNDNVVDFTEAGLKEAAKHFIPVALEFGVIAVVADVATNVWN